MCAYYGRYVFANDGSDGELSLNIYELFFFDPWDVFCKRKPTSLQQLNNMAYIIALGNIWVRNDQKSKMILNTVPVTTKINQIGVVYIPYNTLECEQVYNDNHVSSHTYTK